MVALLVADGLFLMTDQGSKHNATRSRLRIYKLAYVRVSDFRDFPVGREIPERMSAQVAMSGGSADLGFKSIFVDSQALDFCFKGRIGDSQFSGSTRWS
jgi:hypothetical protein